MIFIAVNVNPLSILAETHVVLGVVKGMGREEEVIQTLPEFQMQTSWDGILYELGEGA